MKIRARNYGEISGDKEKQQKGDEVGRERGNRMRGKKHV